MKESPRSTPVTTQPALARCKDTRPAPQGAYQHGISRAEAERTEDEPGLLAADLVGA
jgi:hypothetical protein